MRSKIGLFVIFASFVAVGCANPTDATNETGDADNTSTAMTLDPAPVWREPPPSWKSWLPPPEPVVLQSISGYAGFPNELGHENGPSHSTFVRPTHLSSNSTGTTWVVDEDPNDYWLGYVRVIQDTRGGVGTPDKHVQTTFNLYELGFGPWNLGGLVVAENGTDAYLSDVWSHAIYKVTMGQGRSHFSGGIVTWYPQFAGGFVDGAPNVARFMSPTGLARDAGGYVYVADTGNSAIRRIAPNGYVSTIASGPYLSPPFNPTNLAVGANGWIFAVSGSTVFRVLPTGQISVLAGGFNQPKGITVDRLGDVYIADSGNHAIKKITVATGAVSTISSLPGFSPTRGMFDTYGPDDNVLTTPWGLSFWGDRLVFSDADRPTVRTLNPAPPQ